MNPDKDKKTNFEIQLKAKIKKIPDSDNQIIVHALKESLQDFIEKIKKYLDDNILHTTDILKELEKQLDFNQLEKIQIDPEILERIKQADLARSAYKSAVPGSETAISSGPRPLAPPGVQTPAYTSSPSAQQQYPSQPPPVPGSETTPISVPRISVPDFSTPSTAPTAPSTPEISFSIPRVSLKTEPEQSPLSAGSIVDEEDRATGIAILRKKMLMELKKIRSVVSEEEEF
ncbi:MAG: hypothetical protein ACFFD4_37290 [Candidatus Odinarchaeota archaeon]